ncbi:hypothetical protein BJ165DRAFT_1535146 [Panaeolus papilionaceus]|nr:hypothetical protein BJ165DRAFT_1535146 [Panaeolus papilionaceus]
MSHLWIQGFQHKHVAQHTPALTDDSNDGHTSTHGKKRQRTSPTLSTTMPIVTTTQSFYPGVSSPTTSIAETTPCRATRSEPINRNISNHRWHPTTVITEHAYSRLFKGLNPTEQRMVIGVGALVNLAQHDGLNPIPSDQQLLTLLVRGCNFLASADGITSTHTTPSKDNWNPSTANLAQIPNPVVQAIIYQYHKRLRQRRAHIFNSIFQFLSLPDKSHREVQQIINPWIKEYDLQLNNTDGTPQALKTFLLFHDCIGAQPNRSHVASHAEYSFFSGEIIHQVLVDTRSFLEETHSTLSSIFTFGHQGPQTRKQLRVIAKIRQFRYENPDIFGTQTPFYAWSQELDTFPENVVLLAIEGIINCVQYIKRGLQLVSSSTPTAFLEITAQSYARALEKSKTDDHKERQKVFEECTKAMRLMTGPERQAHANKIAWIYNPKGQLEPPAVDASCLLPVLPHIHAEVVNMSARKWGQISMSHPLPSAIPLVPNSFEQDQSSSYRAPLSTFSRVGATAQPAAASSWSQPQVALVREFQDVDVGVTEPSLRNQDTLTPGDSGLYTPKRPSITQTRQSLAMYTDNQANTPASPSILSPGNSLQPATSVYSSNIHHHGHQHYLTHGPGHGSVIQANSGLQGALGHNWPQQNLAQQIHRQHHHDAQPGPSDPMFLDFTSHSHTEVDQSVSSHLYPSPSTTNPVYDSQPLEVQQPQTASWPRQPQPQLTTTIIPDYTIGPTSSMSMEITMHSDLRSQGLEAHPSLQPEAHRHHNHQLYWQNFSRALYARSLQNALKDNARMLDLDFHHILASYLQHVDPQVILDNDPSLKATLSSQSNSIWSEAHDEAKLAALAQSADTAQSQASLGQS